MVKGVNVSDEEASKYPHSAISTWSGFVYQGKVALYHCLKLINEGYSDSNYSWIAQTISRFTKMANSLARIR